MSLRQTPVALALSLAFPFAAPLALMPSAHAQGQSVTGTSATAAVTASASSASATPTPTPAQLGELTVSATRTERAAASVPNTVTVIPRRELDRRDARDLKDLLADEVDLAVKAVTPRFTAAGASTGRAGNEGINIRGLEGNRVLMMVDGIRVPQSFAFGAFASGRADFVDLDSLSSAEVLRGPTSTSYGSDGLAGALMLRTLSPEDLLKDGKTFAGYGRIGLRTVDDSKDASAAVAFSSGDWSSLVQASVRRGHETETRGDNGAANANRTKANPTDIDTHSVMAKVGYRLNAQHRLMGTAEYRERKTDTNVLSAVTAPPASGSLASTAVLGLDAHDKMDRTRLSLEHRYEDLNASWIQQVTTQVYVQDSETRQVAYEDRNTAADRTRIGHYKEHLIGLSTQAQTQLSNQRLSYGLDVSRNRIEGLRDGTVPPAGETFPNKPFPDTDYDLAGAYLQDEIEVGNLSLIPALRYERYKLSPKASGYSSAVTSLSDSAVTPRLGAVWRVSANLQPYVQWAQGFRAPTPDQVNNGFANPAQGYRSEGNPNLKAEHANSWEIGLRGKWTDGLRWQLSAYDNRYRDFISQEVVSGAGTPANPLVFQYVNLSQARIKGVEARAVWDITSGLSVKAAVAKARGHSIENGVETPLDSIQPLRATLGVSYEVGDWSLQGSWLHSNGKKASDISTATYFAPGKYDVIDVGGGYRINKTLRLSAAVTNLFDKKYWRWSDVSGIAANSNVLDGYTAPGRALQVSLRADF
ncbi:TonB-dependent hemoglobin/transferrin/lactoferrin family receptor [Roseateles amylovorans]|uniref:TonB-dependent hemoglobin/transferrin/lactoferrin family receptor n=1 Tax=Roseateles amylovorans TaxID=2978473 RepID=A0ABY6AWJ9_9BURK|nr:TonB-dependent hemoglobin/transferrin/lactoferrin family receptor [Roseateles amylovorans]UXH77551.1 TonB-dependent hemoglobin/transferrin/lactoferrin family receptor [Roseateles amylovorans]